MKKRSDNEFYGLTSVRPLNFIFRRYPLKWVKEIDRFKKNTCQDTRMDYYFFGNGEKTKLINRVIDYILDGYRYKEISDFIGITPTWFSLRIKPFIFSVIKKRMMN